MSQWIKASVSNAQGSCVQMRRVGEMIEVRDSKDPDGPVLRFTARRDRRMARRREAW